MEGRKLSGSYWRKRKLEKQEKEKKILESTPKLTKFFTRDKHNTDVEGSSRNEPQPGPGTSNGENNACLVSEMETQESDYSDSEMEPQDSQESVLPNNTVSGSIIGRLGKCEVCGFHDAKYTCPKCEVKTCSLKCNKIHKIEIECDGNRDRTRFVPVKEFSNLDLSSDYRLLEEISRKVEAVKKNAGRKVDSHIIPTHLFKLRNAAHQRKTTLKFLPYKFARRRHNTSQLNFKLNIIQWHIDWIFVNADNLKVSESKVSEIAKLGAVLHTYLQKQTDPSLQEKLQYYQAADISGLKLFLKAEQKPGKKFYELDYNDTIKECLSKKLIIEYPTIHVLLKDHGCAYDVIDSDDEEDGSDNKDDVKTGNEVVEKILSKAENDESLYKSLKNLLFVSEYSDEDISE